MKYAIEMERTAHGRTIIERRDIEGSSIVAIGIVLGRMLEREGIGEATIRRITPMDAQDTQAQAPNAEERRWMEDREIAIEVARDLENAVEMLVKRWNGYRDDDRKTLDAFSRQTGKQGLKRAMQSLAQAVHEAHTALEKE